MEEEKIIEIWLENQDTSWHQMSEVPVGRPGVRKWMDVLLIENLPFDSEEEMKRKARQEVSGYRFNRSTNSFRHNQDELQFILNHIDNHVINIKIYECKQNLTAEALGQILIYRTMFSKTYDFDGEINIVEYGIIHGEDHPTIRAAAESLGVSIHHVCPECEWTGQIDEMVDTAIALECPICYARDGDTERMLTLQNRFHRRYNMNGKLIRFRAAALEYFGEEPSPDDPLGYMPIEFEKKFASAIAIARGEVATAVDGYLNRFDTRDQLISELESAFDEIGLEDESGRPPSNLSAEKIGPTIPWVLAILSMVHGVDIEEALEKQGPKIDEANRRDPKGSSYPWE